MLLRCKSISNGCDRSVEAINLAMDGSHSCALIKIGKMDCVHCCERAKNWYDAAILDIFFHYIFILYGHIDYLSKAISFLLVILAHNNLIVIFNESGRLSIAFMRAKLNWWLDRMADNRWISATLWLYISFPSPSYHSHLPSLASPFRPTFILFSWISTICDKLLDLASAKLLPSNWYYSISSNPCAPQKCAKPATELLSDFHLDDHLLISLVRCPPLWRTQGKNGLHSHIPAGIERLYHKL